MYTFFWLKLYNFTYRDDLFEVVWYCFYVFCCLFIHVRDGTVHSRNGMNIFCILCQGEQSEWSPCTKTCTARPVTSRHALCCNSLTWCVTGSCWEAWHSPSSSWGRASGLWSPPYFLTGVCTVLRHHSEGTYTFLRHQREGAVIASIFSDRCAYAFLRHHRDGAVIASIFSDRCVYSPLSLQGRDCDRLHIFRQVCVQSFVIIGKGLWSPPYIQTGVNSPSSSQERVQVCTVFRPHGTGYRGSDRLQIFRQVCTVLRHHAQGAVTASIFFSDRNFSAAAVLRHHRPWQLQTKQKYAHTFGINPLFMQQRDRKHTNERWWKWNSIYLRFSC